MSSVRAGSVPPSSPAYVSAASPWARTIPTSSSSASRTRTLPTCPGAWQLDGPWAAISGETADAVAVARELAATLGLKPFELADGDRTLYHAGAVFASNYLVTLQRAAVRLGVPAEGVVPLMRGTIDHGFELTGPIARGDWATIERHKEAIRAEHPELEHLYDTLAEATVLLA